MTIPIPEDLNLPENTTLIPNMKAFYPDDDIGGVLVPCYVRLDLPSPVTPARMARIRRLAGAPANPHGDTQIARELQAPLDSSALHRELEARGLYLRPVTSSTDPLTALLNEAGVAGVVMTTREHAVNFTDWWIIRSGGSTLTVDDHVTGRAAAKQSVTIAQGGNDAQTVFVHELNLAELQVLLERVSDRFYEDHTPEEERALSPEHWPLSNAQSHTRWVAVISIPEDESMSANEAADLTIIGSLDLVHLSDLGHEDHPHIPGAYLTQAELGVY